jgi:hypothetical protein
VKELLWIGLCAIGGVFLMFALERVIADGVEKGIR